MEVLDVAISLVIVVALCAFASARCHLHSALAPLAALGFAMCWFTLGGVLGALRIAGWLLAMLAAGLLVYTLASRGLKAVLRALCTPGFLLFLAAALTCLLVFAVRQPVLSEWDEFSFWGTAAKLVKQDNALYTTADIGWEWPGTERPGLVLLGYFVQFFGSFAAWKVYFAVNLLLFACMAAALATVKGRQWRLWVPAALVLLALPFVFNVFHRLVYFDNSYLSAYADLPAGFVFGGVLCTYYALRARGRGLWWALPALGALCLMKDNLVPVALVAAVLMAVDTLVFRRQGVRRRTCLLEAGATLVTPLCFYWVWSAHVAKAVAANPYTQGQSTGANVFTSAVEAVRQLLGLAPKSERFASVLGQYGAALFDSRDYPATLFGSVAVSALVVLALFAAAMWLAGTVRARLQVGLLALVTLLGFLAYQFELLVSYGFVFKTEGITDFGRYQSGYLAGWMLIAFASFVAAASPLVRISLRSVVARGALSLAAMGLALTLVVLAPARLTVLGYSDARYEGQRLQAAQAAEILSVVGPGERIFLVCQGGVGLEWFEWSYYLLPAVLDYSVSGGQSIQPPEVRGMDTSAGGLEAYLYDAGCQYVLVTALDAGFIETYGALFADNLVGFGGAPTLYRRDSSGRFAPLMELEGGGGL